MSQVLTSLETKLYNAYREELAEYSRALAVAGEVVEGLRTGAPTDALLSEMLAALDAIASIEARIASAKDDWRRQQCQPGPELSALLDETAQVIVHLTAQVQQAEQVAAVHKARLCPELDTASRGRQMQQAYGQAMTHARAAFDGASR